MLDGDLVHTPSLPGPRLSIGDGLLDQALKGSTNDFDHVHPTETNKLPAKRVSLRKKAQPSSNLRLENVSLLLSH